MPLFTFTITTHDGEREYSEQTVVHADRLEQVEEYAAEKLATYFGDEAGEDGDDPETIIDSDGSVWDSFHEVCAELEGVSDYHQSKVYSVSKERHLPAVVVVLPDNHDRPEAVCSY